MKIPVANQLAAGINAKTFSSAGQRAQRAGKKKQYPAFIWPDT